MFYSANVLAKWDNSRLHRPCLQWGSGAEEARLFGTESEFGSRSWLRTHARSILLGVILFTLPFYCLGFILWGISPSGDSAQRIQTTYHTTETPALAFSPTASGMPSPSYTPSPSHTPTDRPPSATPFRIPQQPPTSLPYLPPSALPATATDYPLPATTATHTRAPLLPATNTARP